MEIWGYDYIKATTLFVQVIFTAWLVTILVMIIINKSLSVIINTVE